MVTAPGKRPATFRTWKLSPAAPMVLQPIGCGRVGHRHNTPDQRGMTPHHAVSSLSFYTPTPSNRRNKQAPHTRPQFDQLTPRDTTHQRTNVAHICPRGMGCLMHGLHSYTRTIHAASLTAPSLAYCIGVHTRIGCAHADRLITYPHVRFLSGCVLVPGPGDPPNSQFFAILHL